MVFTERFDFSVYGKEYEGSFVRVRLFSRAESVEYVKAIADFNESRIGGSDLIENAEEVINYAYKTVQKQFVDGAVMDKEALREMAVEDVMDLPPKVVGDIVNVIRGMPVKKN